MDVDLKFGAGTGCETHSSNDLFILAIVLLVILVIMICCFLFRFIQVCNRTMFKRWGFWFVVAVWILLLIACIWLVWYTRHNVSWWLIALFIVEILIIGWLLYKTSQV